LLGATAGSAGVAEGEGAAEALGLGLAAAGLLGSDAVTRVSDGLAVGDLRGGWTLGGLTVMVTLGTYTVTLATGAGACGRHAG
jgi:hypothetical protein